MCEINKCKLISSWIILKYLIDQKQQWMLKINPLATS